MYGVILSRSRSYDWFYGIMLLTCVSRCGFCDAVNKHGFGESLEIINESRGCDTCGKTYLLNE